MLFYYPKNNLAEFFKILINDEDNSLRITHYALRITIIGYDYWRSRLTLIPLTLTRLTNTWFCGFGQCFLNETLFDSRN